jgi:hypothetical protein
MIQWNKTFSGVVPVEKESSIIIETFDDSGESTGYLLASSVSQPSHGIWVIKMDSSGTIQWQGIYHSEAGNIFVNSIKQSPDGNYLIVGNITETIGSINRMFLMKIASDGDILWANGYRLMLFDRDNDDIGTDIDITEDGHIIMLGYSTLSGSGSEEYIVILNLYENGYMNWQKIYRDFTGMSLLRGYSIKQTYDSNNIANGFVVAARREMTTGDDQQPGGLPIIIRDLGGGVILPQDDGEDGGEIPLQLFKLLVLRLDNGGNLVWHRDFSNLSPDSNPTVDQVTDGSFVATAMTTESNIWVLKMDNSGSLTWQRSFGGNQSDRPSNLPGSLYLTNDGGYIIVGETSSYSSDMSDAWILKLKPDGLICAQE